MCWGWLVKYIVKKYFQILCKDLHDLIQLPKLFFIKRYKNDPFGIEKKNLRPCQVVPGDAMAPSDFGGSVKPISTGGELREAIVPKK